MESEIEFENKLINHLEMIGGKKQWQYKPEIKTEEKLWENFRTILERNNSEVLKGSPLTDSEFDQVKRVITDLKSPYGAGCWLYGMNGVTQVEVERDPKEDKTPQTGDNHIYLTVFDQDQIGSGNTTYQIVNQVKRDHVKAGHLDRRFDTTLLINGLPIIHIEEKAFLHEANEALNQIHQYVDEGLFGGIYATTQIFVGITPYEAKYMANADSGSFSTDFAFRWQREADSKPVWDWREFCDLVLSIPMAHQMSTNFMILDGSIDHKKLIVMRPYQVYATRRVLEKLSRHIFGNGGNQNIGYIWHTTGSGKTISSFKTAWLASRLPNVDKVVFVVDRVALTRQTYANYSAYDPDTDSNNNGGIVTDTQNTGVLASKLKSRKGGNSIIVTSIQKLAQLSKRDSFTAPDQNIVFIVDEAHRSTNGDMFGRIKDKFPKSAWVGYTGTPAFDNDLTYKAFGDLLHAYTIREAISDHNVLGFKVDFENTLSSNVINEKLLPELLKGKYPKWNDDEIARYIAKIPPEEVDDLIDSGVYDDNPEHVKAVVDNIVSLWRNRSKDGKYSAILTTHVGGGRASAPMALMYFDEFQRANQELTEEDKRPLNIAVTFSWASDNSDGQLMKNKGLRRAMEVYNAVFQTSFTDETVEEYFEDVTERIKGSAQGEKLDIVIVIDQLLTGFDAPMVNTLYVDRILSGAGLIQAYSRTNRIESNQDKPFGKIVNFRYPQTSKNLMDKALRVYANRDSAAIQYHLGKEGDLGNVVEPPFSDAVHKTKDVIFQLSELSDNFSEIPGSEAAKQQMIHVMREFNMDLSKLKQYDEFDYDNPEQLFDVLGVTQREVNWLQGPAYNELQRWTAIHREDGEGLISGLDFAVEHINEVKINYDYLNELLAKVFNDAHEGKETLDKSYETFIHETDKLEDRHYAEQLKRAASAAKDGDLIPVSYPVEPKDIDNIVHKHVAQTRREKILEFRQKWGLVDVISAAEIINSIIDRHTLDRDDTNDGEDLAVLLRAATINRFYQHDATDPEIRQLPKIRYRRYLREAIRKLADEIALYF